MFLEFTLTVVVAVDDRVPRLQVNVVLSALSFTAVQPALRPHAHLLHTETRADKIKD